MTLQEFFANLDFQPMDTLPWVRRDHWEDPEDAERFKEMPCGIVLRRQNLRVSLDRFVLVGNEVSGRNTTGCSCCSGEWREDARFNGWAWAFPFLTLDNGPRL